MKGVLRYWRYLLQAMFTPPWKPIYDLEGRELDAFNLWFAGWGYSLFGIVALGIVAPFWVQGLRIPSQYQEGVIIGIACMGGFIWQAAILLVYPTRCATRWQKSFLLARGAKFTDNQKIRPLRVSASASAHET